MSEISTDEPDWSPPIDLDASAPDSVGAWDRWSKAPSPASLSGVLKTVKPVIDGAVARNKGVNEGLLRSEAKRLAIQAFKTFDPAAGASLNTHVFGHLRSLGRFSQKMTRAIDVPRERNEEIGRLVKFERDFQEQNLRDPLDEEVQDHFGISSKKLTKLRGGVFYEFPEGGLEGDLEFDPEESRLARWSAFVYQDLPPKDRLIMDHMTGAGGRPPLSPNDLAAKMGLDPSYVRKRAATIAQKILEGVK